MRLGAASVAAILIASGEPAGAATYYFVDGSSASCSDSGPGTEAQPFCTINSAVDDRGGPGVTIIVKPGIYPERVTISASGGPGSPLAIMSAAGGVVVDGADDFTSPSQWEPFSGDVWLAAAVSWGPRQVFLDGARIDSSGAAPGALPARSYCYVPGSGLYVHAGGGNPAARQARVGRRENGFSLYAVSWVTIDGFTVTRTEDRAIELGDACTHIALTRDTVSFSREKGIHVSGGSDNVIGSSVVHDCGDHGIELSGGATGCLIEDTESFRNAHPTVRVANGIYLHQAPGNVLRRNRTHHNQDSGVHFQSQANDCVAYLNRSWLNGDHGFDHLGASGTIHFCDVAYGNYKDGFSIEGQATGTQLHDCIAIDNGLTTNEFNLWVEGSSTSGFVSDYNIFWNSTSQGPVKYGTTIYSSVEDFSQASGRDAHSLQADPRFVNAPAGDFHLQPSSPAIDNGDSAPPGWPDRDADLLGRVNDPATPDAGPGPVPFSDRGAYEYRPLPSPNPPPVARLEVTPSAGTAPLVVVADGSGSSDENGSWVSYRFDFGDGVVVGPGAARFASHSYAVGTWTLKLVVTGAGGLADSMSLTVTVAPNHEPEGWIAWPKGDVAIFCGQSAEFAGTASDPDLDLPLSFQWEFGGGAPNSTEENPGPVVFGAAGTYIVTFTACDVRGVCDPTPDQRLVTVTAPPPCDRNMVDNPSFEPDTQGWEPAGGAIARVPGGWHGSHSCRVTGPATTEHFGVESWPPWVTWAEAGQKFRLSAWVRSEASGGSVAVKAREYVNESLVGEANSPEIPLSPAWQRLEVEYVALQTGSILDMLIRAAPDDTSASFDVDEVSICPMFANTGVGDEVEGAGDVTPSVAPNPVIGRATLRFSTRRAGPLRAVVFDSAGRRVRTLVDVAESSAGLHALPLDDRGDDGAALSSGIYFCRIESADGVARGRFLILR